MSAIGTQNPFAPPRALVDDTFDTQQPMVFATRGARFVAVLIDSVASWIVVIGILAAVALPAYQRYMQRARGLPVTGGSAFGPAVGVTMGLLGIALLVFFVISAVFVYRYGQTIGKRMMGIRVVRSDGSRVAFSRFIFLRWLPLFILGIIPYLGYAISLVNALLIFRESHQCLHDNIADTKVVTASTSESATLAGASGAHLRTISF